MTYEIRQTPGTSLRLNSATPGGSLRLSTWDGIIDAYSVKGMATATMGFIGLAGSAAGSSTASAVALAIGGSLAASLLVAGIGFIVVPYVVLAMTQSASKAGKQRNQLEGITMPISVLDTNPRAIAKNILIILANESMASGNDETAIRLYEAAIKMTPAFEMPELGQNVSQPNGLTNYNLGSEFTFYPNNNTNKNGSQNNGYLGVNTDFGGLRDVHRHDPVDPETYFDPPTELRYQDTA